MNRRSPLPVLAERFDDLDAYAAGTGADYSLLPFRFLRLDADRYVATNFAGEHVVLPSAVLQDLARHRLPAHSPWYDELKSRHFLVDADSSVALDLLAAKYRTKQARLASFTSLFMFVVTLRCDHTCRYCQVSRQTEDRTAFDMTRETADRGVDFMFRSPSRAIKVEFQGGESLLNFDLIRHVVRRVEERNERERRDVAFVIATNLAPLTDEHLEFCRQHGVALSTSLDGPRELHNRNRPRPGRDSYERTVDGIRRARAALGHDAVAALMTTTEASLSQPEAIVDEYVRLGFGSVFLRSISPYGFAARTGLARGYEADDWLTFYRRGLARVIEHAEHGVPIREEFAAILLRKILTPYATGYVDLQSPAGLGIAGVVINYDGDVYASDEARMLAEMGDRTFRLGRLETDTYERIIGSDVLVETLLGTMSEGVPGCADCGVQPYCGSDPVYHHAVQGDAVGHKPTSGFCRKNMGVIRHLITLLEDDPRAARVLRGWA